MPETLPDWPILIIRLTCLGGLSPSLEGGRSVVELLPSPGGRIAIAWERPLAMGEMLPSLGGRWAVAGRELLPSWEGRWAIAGVRLLPSLGGRWAVAGRELLPSWEGRWAIAGVRLLPSPGGRRAVAGRELLPSWEGRWAIAWELLSSWEGRWAMAWEGETKPVCGGFGPSPSYVGGRGLAQGVLLPSLGGKGVPACLFGLLPAWERLLLLLLLEYQVIFPSFLFTKFWNFLICLSLTMLNLVSPTLSIKPWHSQSLSVEMIDTSWDLHCSICWAMLLRMLLILLILSWIKSFSTFLIIFLALVVFKVDFSLILTGTNSLCRHLKVNIWCMQYACTVSRSWIRHV